MCDEYIQVLSLFWSVLQLSHGDHHSDCVCVFLGGRVLAGLFIGGTELGIFICMSLMRPLCCHMHPQSCWIMGCGSFLHPPN